MPWPAGLYLHIRFLNCFIREAIHISGILMMTSLQNVFRFILISIMAYQVITGYLLAGSAIGPGGASFVSELVQVSGILHMQLIVF